ncbi:hypothetical protein [Bacillus testis]|uniref:hypothetical protein n=1 Tax=Bacillus testis TaxID=1622072 RepID=UPI00067E8095|nr:hypothetical protein [Bacillus testis]
MKRIFIATSFVLIFLICFSMFIVKSYTIENNNQDIQKSLTEWEKKNDSTKTDIKKIDKIIDVPNVKEENPKLLKVVQLGDSNIYVAHYLLRDQTAFAVMKKGLNGKLKIKFSKTGSSRPMYDSYDSIKTNKGYFLVISGKKENNIKNINAKIHDIDMNYKLKIPDDKYYLIVKKMPESIKKRPNVELLF